MPDEILRPFVRVADWTMPVLLAGAVGYITPYVERQVLDVIDGLATDETWGKIWDEGILPGAIVGAMQLLTRVH